MRELPHDSWLDATLPLLHEPYTCIPRHCAEAGASVLRARLLGRPAYLMTGREAAGVFYGPGMHREGAVPRIPASTLFGPRGVIQGTDGAEHAHRKRRAMELVQGGTADDLALRFIDALEAARPGWPGEVDLFEIARDALTRAVCGWAGVPLDEGEVSARGRMLSAMFLEAGAKTPAGRLRGARARRAAQRWLEPLIRDIRAGAAPVPPEAPAARAARWTHADGRLLDVPVAAADLMSFLRPTVANAVWVVHIAHALHAHPAMAPRVAEDAAYRHAFVLEVRRLYPFFPVLAAIVGDGVAWRGRPLKPGARAVLSIWGTNRDDAVWEAPEFFRPSRHQEGDPGPFDMIAQGGGGFHETHRCAGEWVTMRQCEAAAEWLTARIGYTVATPEAEPDLRHPPGLPRGGFRLRGLHAV
ncbi:cytochrome P450 [Jannaschia formosa]|uniref:cytochrome P450 n=1 Tax=Jannaschia formosa TaxID=2259592 RepID=UPI000E1BEE4D|nr:cytochrome P450 [Jannaschia formosa]TFL19197.1 cytochrome P450 [Jannaschia formosa]